MRARTALRWVNDTEQALQLTNMRCGDKGSKSRLGSSFSHFDFSPLMDALWVLSR